MDIKGKAAIVTGSSSETGIGAECAKIIASRGCNVVVNYASNKDGAERTAALCRQSGAEALVVQGDVAKDDDCRRLVDTALKHWGRLDVLVNNAAVTKPIPHRELDKLDAAEFQRIYSVNSIGNFQMTRAAFKPLKASGDGAVVNISSVGAWHAAGSSMAYVSSKGALNSLTVAFARIFAPEVRVNALCPGGMAGNWSKKILGEEGYQARMRKAETEYPLRRMVTPAEVARAALFLIEGATGMTGEWIRMDAGQHLR
jgi:NAD(P)-dependent dehydrogenase (short-subunit alcohol dehydrogenase family)